VECRGSGCGSFAYLVEFRKRGNEVDGILVYTLDYTALTPRHKVQRQAAVRVKDFRISMTRVMV
jgi:hypothetical protein